MKIFFQGLYTDLITPLKDGSIDLNSFEKIVQYQLSYNVDGIIIGGSTGEAASLTQEEYIKLLTLARSMIPKNIQLIAGISANVNSYAVEMAKIAENIGVDGIMCITPFYNKPPQRGLYNYFKDIHENTNLPIMLYTVPGRTGVDFVDQIILELARLERILAIKDAGTDLERPLRLHHKVKKDFSFLSGEDSSSIAYSSHGGRGCVSVVSNIIPKICKELQDLLLKQNFAEALRIQSDLLPIIKAAFSDTNPIAVKYAVSLLGLCSAEMRPPLYEIIDQQIRSNIESQIADLKAKSYLT